MDDSLLKFTQESLIRYFNVLSQFGYKSYCDVDKLITLIFLQECLAKYQQFITEGDYNVISKATECLYGTSCLMPYQYYQTNQTTYNNFADANVQSTEDSEIKVTEPVEQVRIIQ